MSRYARLRRRAAGPVVQCAIFKGIVACAFIGGCAPTARIETSKAPAAPTDVLLAGFGQPPHEARPQVWWHWMNGNINADQAVADLEWAARQGIGGVHIFEGGLNASKVVDRRLTYMSPEWQAALRASVTAADRLGIDVSIATSPGWSSTGGPWVSPAMAMKKLVWSETTVRGGMHDLHLSLPSSIAGPYQDVPADDPAPAFYRDVAVVAFPSPEEPAGFTISASSAINMALLRDGGLGATTRLLSGRDGLATITFRARQPVEVGGVQVGLPAPHGFGAPPPPDAQLQTSDDGRTWRPVVALTATTAPTRTAAFSSVRSSWFRLVVRPAAGPGLLASLPHEPGAIRLTLPPPAAGFLVSEVRLLGRDRINAAEAKAGFTAARDYYGMGTPASAIGARRASVLDLTQRLRPDGSLDWTPPSGKWTVLRFGMSLTGHRNGPAPEEATGLEVDKLSAGHVARYLDRYLGGYDAALGPRKLNGLLSDSIEAGAQNWTDAMPEEFEKRRGYALTSFLPALAGYVVEDAATSDRFLYDFRRTIGDLLADAHYGTIARFARDRGQTYYAEALEDHRPQLGDDLAMRASADIPVGAMWFFEPGEAPKPTYTADLKGASSVAHVMGRSIVGVEALTSFGYPWALTPARMRAAADAAFLTGGNRLMLHSMVHQAAGDRVFPGLTLLPQLGHNFNRNEAWAPFARGWTDYLARSQFLLQQGVPQTDFAYFIGEEAPVTGLYGDTAPAGIPEGMSYDYVDATLLAKLTPEAGRLRNRAGNGYAFLFLGGTSRQMTGTTLTRLEDLARAGVTIAGRPPVASPSLMDRQADFAVRVAALWRRKNVLDVATPREAASQLRLRPSWRYVGNGTVEALHRVIGGTDLFYVVNRSATSARGHLTVLSRRRHAQWWDAVAGTTENAPRDADGTINVDLLPNESRFLTLRDDGADAPSWTAPRQVAAIDDGWTVALASRGRADRQLTLGHLTSLERNVDPLVRGFSGIAAYQARFVMPGSARCVGGRRWLEFTTVADVGRVSVNGRDMGFLWTKPFRVDVTNAVHRGANDLRVEVANTWKNRLIADAASGDDAARQYYRPDAPLSAAGLSGAVRVVERCPR